MQQKLAFTLLTLSILFAVANTASYNYYQQGADWNDTCATGEKQSPIDLPQSGRLEDSQNAWYLNSSESIKIMPSYDQIYGVVVANLTTTIQVNFSNGYLTVWDYLGNMRIYQVAQFHFHSPSEHTVDEKHYDLEVHIVHKEISNPDNLAVIALFFDRAYGGNSASAFIDSLGLIDPQSKNWNSFNKVTAKVPLTDLMKDIDKKSFYQYEGSLTTPNCTESVLWNVVASPFPISEAQFQIFNNSWLNNTAFANNTGNNRVTQNINGREIYYSSVILAASNSFLLQTLNFFWAFLLFGYLTY